MKQRLLIVIGLIAALLMLGTTLALAGTGAHAAMPLPDAVRQATMPFQDIARAKAAGYGLFHGCVSSPQEGAMGIHYANGGLVGDGALDAAHPEALLYEPVQGKLQLVGVEYLVLAADWNARNTAPPVLNGQVFNFVGAPNRYGLPAFYELHVWAWKHNPLGVFADWNPRVSCASYAGEAGAPAHH